MPEGPEVKKLVNNLNTYRGLYIIDCKITPTSRYRDKAPDNYLLFKEKLPLKLKRPLKVAVDTSKALVKVY